MRSPLLLAPALLCLALSLAATNAAASGADLATCLRLADRNHPNVQVARAKLAAVRAQLTEAYSAPWMQFKASGGIALAPTVRGSNIYSPNTDVSLTSSLGVAWRANISGVVPIWTFGKITNLWDAAEANVDVNVAGVEVERDAVRFDVRQAYLGLQLSRDGLNILDDSVARINEAVAALEKKVEADDGDPIDLLKLQTFSAEIYIRKSEAERFQRIALAGLRFYTGIDNLEVKDEPLKKAPHRLGSIRKYLDAARVYRPEVHMARAGIAAREAQLRLSRSKMFPDLGLGLNAGMSAAPEISNQINPYVKDQGNYISYGAALVFQWNLDFVPGVARIEQSEAKLRETLALQDKALGGVAAEVEEAYAEVVDWQTRREAYRKAEKLSKRWLVMVQQAIDIGTMDEDELLDPSKSYAQHRYNVLKATMEYNLALSKLAQKTGWDAIAAGR
jgi:outer membrane protein TolC